MLTRLVHTYREAFAGLSRTVWLLSGVTFVHRSGTMVLPFLSLYLTSQLGMSARWAGLYLALYGVGSVIGAFVGGRLSDAFGTRAAMLFTLVGAGLGFGVLAGVTEPLAIAVVLLLTSIAAEGFRPPSGAALADVTEPASQVRAFALRRLAINLGMTVAPAVGGLLATVDYRWLFIIDGATCLLAAVGIFLLLPAARLRREQDEAPATDATPAPSPWRDTLFLRVLAWLIVLEIAFFQMLSTFPLTLYDFHGFGEQIIGLTYALNTILIVLFEMVLVHSVRRQPVLRMVALGALALSISFLLIPVNGGLPVVLLAIAILTFGEMLTMPLLEGFVASRAPRASLGRYLGLYTASFSVASIIAPVVGTWVYDALGHHALWLGASFFAVASAVGFVWLDRRARLA